MVLLIIFGVIVLGIAILCAIVNGYERLFTFFGVLFLGVIVALPVLFIINSIGYQLTKTESYNKFPIQLASINDGTGVKGRFSGGLFISRGYIEDTQHYSYYIRNENGSYNLQKRQADKSTIWQDVEAKDARVDITDKITICKPQWWLWCSGEPKVEFSSADFHVPVGSVIEEFTLNGE